MKLSTKNAATGYALILPLMAGCVIFYGLAFGLILWFSMTGSNAKVYAGLDNYLQLFGNQGFRLALGNTLRFLLIGLLLILTLSYAIALLLKSKLQRHRALKAVVLLPYVMPVVGTVLLIDVLFTQTGLLSKTVAGLGLPVQDWLHSDYAFWIVMLLYLWKNTGYSVILLLSGLVTVPQEHYSAASLDGAGPWQQFRRITMPQMWYSVFFAGVFSMINAFKCFREIFLIGGTHPDDSIYMLQHFINNSFEKLSYSKMAAASVLLAGLVSLFFVAGYRYVMRKEAYKE